MSSMSVHSFLSTTSCTLATCSKHTDNIAALSSARIKQGQFTWGEQLIQALFHIMLSVRRAPGTKHGQTLTLVVRVLISDCTSFFSSAAAVGAHN